MKNLSTKNPTVSTTDRAFKYVLANNAFSNGYYTVLAAELYVAFRARFVNRDNEVFLTVARGWNCGLLTYKVVKTVSSKTGNGVAIGCMQFSQNNLNKIAKLVGFTMAERRVYFPRMVRPAKAKTARAGR